LSFSPEKFEQALEDVFILRGWRKSHPDRFKAVFEMYRLYKFHVDDLKYAIAKLQQDDSFDERTLMFYLRESKRSRDPQGDSQTMEDYENRMMNEMGPQWREVSKRCWDFIGKCMGSFDKRSQAMSDGRKAEIEVLDKEKFNKEMAEEFPGLGFDKR
jgi:hypothetical protein